MDLSGAAAGNNKNKRVPDELREVEEDDPKRNCPYFPTGFEAGFGTVGKHLVAEFWPQIEPLIGQVVVERFLAELWPQIENSFRQQVREDIETMIQAQIHSRLPSLRKNAEIGKHITTGSGTLKFKLCFCNPIDSIIFTNNEIKAENGESLKVVICDVTNSNSIISTGPLASAQIEFFILDGDFYSGQRQDETYWTSSDFNESILSSREGKRPLIIGSDLKLYMEMGVGFIKNLIVTDNSSWMRSKNFCLGAKIRDEKIAAEFPRIGEAVSKPFRVMDHRGEVNKKHHPPSREDEVWRLEGIARDGTYHKNLSSAGINNVGDFLKAYRERGPVTLKMLLGKRVLEKTWNMMVKNAEECVDVPPVYHVDAEECVDVPAYHAEECIDVLVHDQTSETHLVEASNKENLGKSDELRHCEEWWLTMINFDDLSPTLSPYGESFNFTEVDDTGTHTPTRNAMKELDQFNSYLYTQQNAK